MKFISTLKDGDFFHNLLKILYLHQNQLNVLSKHIGNLQHLERLTLSYNRLITLPKTIHKLRELFHLSLHHNHIRTLPRELITLNHLRTFIFDDDLLQKIPASSMIHAFLIIHTDYFDAGTKLHAINILQTYRQKRE